MIYFYDGHSQIPGVIHSPILEPTDDNPSGVYGQIQVFEFPEELRACHWQENPSNKIITPKCITCVPGDYIEIDGNCIKIIKKLKYHKIANA